MQIASMQQNLRHYPVMQANGVNAFTWTAPPSLTLLSELLIVAGKMIMGDWFMLHLNGC
jgi:hypothetical protein